MTKQSIQQHQFNAFDFTILLLCDIVPITLVLFIALKIWLSRPTVFVFQKFLRSAFCLVPLVITSITENKSNILVRNIMKLCIMKPGPPAFCLMILEYLFPSPLFKSHLFAWELFEPPCKQINNEMQEFIFNNM